LALPALSAFAIFGLTCAKAAATLLMISSLIGPREDAFELIARRAGTGRTWSPAFCASGVVYALRISAALEFETTTCAPRLHAATTYCCNRR
jgi:hypothetical protein